MKKNIETCESRED